LLSVTPSLSVKLLLSVTSSLSVKLLLSVTSSLSVKLLLSVTSSLSGETFAQCEVFATWKDFVSIIHHQAVSEALGS